MLNQKAQGLCETTIKLLVRVADDDHVVHVNRDRQLLELHLSIPNLMALANNLLSVPITSTNNIGDRGSPWLRPL